MRLDFYLSDKEKEGLKQAIKEAIPLSEREFIKEIVEAGFGECLTLERNAPLEIFRAKVFEQMKSVPKYWKEYQYLVDNPQNKKPWEVLNEFIYVYYEDLENKIKTVWAMLTNMNTRFWVLMAGYALNQYDIVVIDLWHIIKLTDAEIDNYIDSIFVKKTELLVFLESFQKFMKDNLIDGEAAGFMWHLQKLATTNTAYTHNNIIGVLKNARKNR